MIQPVMDEKPQLPRVDSRIRAADFLRAMIAEGKISPIQYLQLLMQQGQKLPLYLSVTEFSDLSGMSRDWVYDKIGAGDFWRNALNGKIPAVKGLEHLASYDIKPRKVKPAERKISTGRSGDDPQ